MRKTIRTIKKERMEQVKEMYLQNMTVTEIAKELGCALSTVSGYVAELGIKRGTTTEDRLKLEKEILRLYREGLNSPQIANEVGCSQSWAIKILRKHGIWQNRTKEENLIDENTKYADNRVVLEKITINGKKYTDITPVFSPR